MPLPTITIPFIQLPLMYSSKRAYHNKTNHTISNHHHTVQNHSLTHSPNNRIPTTPILPLRKLQLIRRAQLLTLLRNPADIRLAGGIPQRDVLLHAIRDTAFFGRGQRRPGRGDARVEAVFVDFLLCERERVLLVYCRSSYYLTSSKDSKMYI